MPRRRGKWKRAIDTRARSEIMHAAKSIRATSVSLRWVGAAFTESVPCSSFRRGCIRSSGDLSLSQGDAKVVLFLPTEC